jgi:hypothetical protein
MIPAIAAAGNRNSEVGTEQHGDGATRGRSNTGTEQHGDGATRGRSNTGTEQHGDGASAPKPRSVDSNQANSGAEAPSPCWSLPYRPRSAAGVVSLFPVSPQRHSTHKMKSEAIAKPAWGKLAACLPEWQVQNLPHATGFCNWLVRPSEVPLGARPARCRRGVPRAAKTAQARPSSLRQLRMGKTPVICRTPRYSGAMPRIESASTNTGHRCCASSQA